MSMVIGKVNLSNCTDDPIELTFENKGMSLYYPQAGVNKPIWVATPEEVLQIYRFLKNRIEGDQ